MKYDNTGERIQDGQAAAAAAAGYGSTGEFLAPLVRDGMATAAAAAGFGSAGELVRDGLQKGQAAAAAEGRTCWGVCLEKDHGRGGRRGGAGRPKGSKTAAAKLKGGSDYGGRVGGAGRPKGSKTAAAS